MELKPGLKLASSISSVQIVVIRGKGDMDLRCCGSEMTTPDAAPDAPVDAETDIQLGKRYTDEAASLEVLCTKAGQGPLAVGGTVLTLKAAKALPASD